MSGGPTLPGLGAHASAVRERDEWLTPLSIAHSLGHFDLDPCSPPGGHIGAARYYTADDDGLSLPWEGRVWLNPPYSKIAPWMARLADHGNGIALTFARTDTAWWFNSIWPRATAYLFLPGRIRFRRRESRAGGEGAPAPSVLVAYGENNADTLRDSGLCGAFASNCVCVRAGTPEDAMTELPTDLPPATLSLPDDPDVELFDLEALRANGLVWALNRHVLHPLGLALALYYPGEATDPDNDDRLPTGWQIVRADDGIFSFAADLDRAGQAKFRAFFDYVTARPGSPEPGPL